MVRQQTSARAAAMLLVCAISSCVAMPSQPADSKHSQRRSLTAARVGQGSSLLDPDYWERRKVTVGTMAPSHRQLQDLGSNNPPEGTSDTRSLVPDTTSYPYNTIGIVRLFQENSAAQCSGALIHPNYVLTAAHCLHDPDSGAEPSSGDFTPAYNPSVSDSVPFGSAAMTNWYIPQDFVDCGDDGYMSCHQKVDFGLMQIDTDYTDYLGFSWDASDAGGLVVNTAGYPGDKCQASDANVPFAGCSMYHSSCTDQAIPSGAAVGQFPCYSYHGQSGSPVWLYNTTSGDRYIRGILSSSGAGSSSDAAGPGAFTLISEVVFDSLNSWMQTQSQ